MDMKKESYEKAFQEDPFGTLVKIHENSLASYKRIAQKVEASNGSTDHQLNEHITSIENALNLLKDNPEKAKEYHKIVLKAENEGREYIQNIVSQKRDKSA